MAKDQFTSPMTSHDSHYDKSAIHMKSE